ncbi:MAG TPA: hypothetical protein DEA08_10215, partial [Planctomycetes bacterium]|nr:hypothetical protein [Planctomycetota bacterium]
MTRFSLPLALPLTLALGLLSPGVLRAQEAPIEQIVDAPYRLHDTVWISGQGKPLKGIITKGKEPGPHKLVIRLLNDIVTEVDRQSVTRILERETPETAYRSRSEQVASKRDPSLHGRLAEWALRQGLRSEAEHQLELAAKAGAGATGLPYRERAVELYERRLDELDEQAPDRGKVQEQILDHAAAGADSPRLLIARARVQRELGLFESALPLLAQARSLLEARAQQASPNGGGSQDGGSDDQGG